MLNDYKKYFTKDWKFYLRNDSKIGNWYGVLLNRIGLQLLKLGRKALRKGGGTFRGKHYMNCSWCGDSQEYPEGLHMSVSRRGARCCKVKPVCNNRK